MRQYLFHTIEDSRYVGVLTLLDYELRTRDILSNLVLHNTDSNKKILVDMASKVGMTEYRFVEFDIDTNGKPILETANYVSVSKEIQEFTDNLLKQNTPNLHCVFSNNH